MKKEDILKANKQDNQKKDVYEMEIDVKGCRLAAMVMFCVALVLLIYEVAIGKGVNPAFYSFLAIFNAVAYGYKAYKIEKNRKINSIVAITWSIMTIVLLIEYFKAF